MPQKGNLAIFEGSNISKTGEIMPTKIGVHALDINSYLHKFFEPIRSIQFFDDHGGLSGFGDMVTFQKRPNFPFGAWTIVHGHQKN